MTLQHLDTVIAFAVVMLGASLLITILTQTASTLFGLRGTNLLWGLKTVLETVDSRLGRDAEQIACVVLTHPIISDSTFSRVAHVPVIGRLVRRWKLATAVRVEEVVAILRLLSSEGNADAQQAQTEVARARAALNAEQKEKIRAMLERIDPGAAGDIRQLATALGALAPGATDEAHEKVRQIAVTAQKSLGNLERCFNAAMDRVSQRFVTQMRIWTIIFAIAFAFLAHMDAFRLFSQLSSNAELQARLIASSDALTKEASVITSAGGNAVPGIYSDAMKQLVRQSPALGRLKDPPSFTNPTRQQYEDWIRRNVNPPAAAERLVAQYDLLVQEGLKTGSDNLADQVSAIKSIYDQTQLQLFPQPYVWNWDSDNIFGLLAAAGLLSLGAPFWYNALKTLTSLRPQVAQKQEAEQT
ncbi:MAG: hypothetical protein ACRD3D_15995 [Terriglobia bacterium]